MKALNVEVSRELGWIHSKEDIAKEFVPEMADGAEKYFNRVIRLDLRNIPMLAPPEPEPVRKMFSCSSMLEEPAVNLFNWKKEA